MTNSADINKAVSACRNIAKKFQSFSIVADTLTELGDVQKQCEQMESKRASLKGDLETLKYQISTTATRREEAVDQLDEAIKNRDTELEIQEAVAANTQIRAWDDAARIVADAQNKADDLYAEASAFKDSADEDLSAVEVQVMDQRHQLARLKDEMAALKERL